MNLTFGPAAVVVDASAAIQAVMDQVPWPRRWAAWAETDTLLLAPAHFPVEVANGLLKGSAGVPGHVSAKLQTIARSGVDVTDRGWHGLMQAVDLATKHRLTVYDALYLQLAIDIEAPLATLDRALAAAARDEGVEVID
jgi:predicted nucleic acid-binding protein